jgi:hypothetical protein
MTDGAPRREGARRVRMVVARVIAILVGVLVALIVLGILLIVLEANRDNVIVAAIKDAAETLVGPFQKLFTLKDLKAEVAVNWGIAAFVYLIVGQVVARLIAP